MPFIDTFGQRKPSHIPALWLVPRWWAFSRDDRYKVGLTKKRNGGWSQSRPQAIYSQHGEQLRQRPTANQGRKLSTKKNDIRAVREQLALINEPHPKSSVLNTGAQQIYRLCDLKSSEPFISTPMAIVNDRRLNHIDENQIFIQSELCKQVNRGSRLMEHQQARHLPIRHKRGQTERRIQRTPSPPGTPRVHTYQPSRLAVKINDLDPILRSAMPTEARFLRPSAAINHHRQPSGNPSNSTHCRKDPMYIGEMIERQNRLMQALLIGENCPHSVWPKHGNQVSGPVSGKEPFSSAVVGAHLLAGSDRLEEQMVPPISEPYMSTHQAYAHPSAFPYYYTPDVDYKGVGCDSHPSVEAPECLLQTSHLDQSPEPLLARHPLPHKQTCECNFDTMPRHTDINQCLCQGIPYERQRLSRLPRDTACKYTDHDDYDTLHEVLSRWLPSNNVCNRECDNVQRTRACHPENQDHKSNNESGILHSADSMLSTYQVHRDRFTDTHHHNHKDLDAYHRSQRCHDDVGNPDMHYPHQARYLPEIVNPPHHRVRDGCGQPGCLDFGYDRGRRTSYVRTRGG